MSDTSHPARQPAPEPDREDQSPRRPWVEPAVEELPPLTDLTLTTGGAIGGGGDTGGGGSTVF